MFIYIYIYYSLSTDQRICARDRRINGLQVCACIHVYISKINVYIYIYIYIFFFVYLSIYVYMRICIYIQYNIYIYIYIPLFSAGGGWAGSVHGVSLCYA